MDETRILNLRDPMRKKWLSADWLRKGMKHFESLLIRGTKTGEKAPSNHAKMSWAFKVHVWHPLGVIGKAPFPKGQIKAKGGTSPPSLR
jgi:hypothetical protein